MANYDDDDDDDHEWCNEFIELNHRHLDGFRFSTIDTLQIIYTGKNEANIYKRCRSSRVT